eukprot:EG_transcript_20456
MSPYEACPTIEHFGDPTCYSPKSKTLVSLHNAANAETMQRVHFNAHFVKEWRLRAGLPQRTSIAELFRILTDGLQKMASSRLWLAVQISLKARRTMRRWAVPACRRLRAEREAVTEDWLTYWRRCEAKSYQMARGRRDSDVSVAFPMTQGKAQAIARAMLVTPEELKEKVVKELYWLLRVQHTRRATLYWQRWFALMRQKRQLQQGGEAAGPPTSAGKDSMDAASVQYMSIHTIDAALFLMVLQPPQFCCVAGRDIKVQELVRLANKNMVRDFDDLGRFRRLPQLRRSLAS